MLVTESGFEVLTLSAGMPPPPALHSEDMGTGRAPLERRGRVASVDGRARQSCATGCGESATRCFRHTIPGGPRRSAVARIAARSTDMLREYGVASDAA